MNQLLDSELFAMQAMQAQNVPQPQVFLPQRLQHQHQQILQKVVSPNHNIREKKPLLILQFSLWVWVIRELSEIVVHHRHNIRPTTKVPPIRSQVSLPQRITNQAMLSLSILLFQSTMMGVVGQILLAFYGTVSYSVSTSKFHFKTFLLVFP